MSVPLLSINVCAFQSSQYCNITRRPEGKERERERERERGRELFRHAEYLKSQALRGFT